MIWAPCCFASCAYCSCFWIIDSLSPVQLACRSAPRTLRAIDHLPRGGARLTGRALAGGPPVTGHETGRIRRAAGGASVEAGSRDGRPGPGGRSALEREHLGERGRLPVPVELDQEHVVVRPCRLIVRGRVPACPGRDDPAALD